jgi:iron complex outermembrane receptor protein
VEGRRIAAGLLGMILTCQVPAQDASEAAGRYAIDIPAEPLSEAVSQLAQQMGLQVMTSSKLFEGRQSQPLAGTFSADDALRRLLSDSGLTFSFVNAHTVAINLANGEYQSAAAAGQGAQASSGVSPGSASPQSAASEVDANVQRSATQDRPGFWSRLLHLLKRDGGDSAGQDASAESVAAQENELALCGTVGVSAMACTTASRRQESAAEIASGDDRLQEVLVTAEKRVQDISKVAAEVTAVTAQDLSDSDVEDADQLQYLVPSMMITNAAGRGIGISIRGIGSADANNNNGTPGIQYSVDGVPTSRPEELSIPLFDIQRVEVLEGPQGTLYGFNSTGGAVNVITNAPLLTQDEAGATVEVGNNDTKRFQAMINIPIGEHWAFRAAGTANYRAGFVTLICPGATMVGNCASGNSNNQKSQDDDNQAGRLQLLGQLSDSMQLRLTATIGRMGGAGLADSNVAVNYGSDFYYHGLPGGAEYSAWNPFPSYQANHFEKFDAQFAAIVGPVELTYLGSYRNFQTHQHASSQLFGPPDEQGSSAADGALRNTYQQYQATYHELRLSNSDRGAVQWIAGINYWWEGIHEDTAGTDVAGYYIPGLPDNPITQCPNDPSGVSCDRNLVGFEGDPNTYRPDYIGAGLNPIYATMYSSANTTNHQSESLFAHAVFALSPAWHLTLGVRQSVDEISRIGVSFGGALDNSNNGWLDGNGSYCEVTGLTCVGNLAADGSPGTAGINVENTPIYRFPKFNWTVGTDYQLTTNQLAYFNVATGYKPGSFNSFAPPDGSFHPYGPESMTSFELGYKAHTSSVSVTSELYYYDYARQQFNSLTYLGGGNTVSYVTTLPSTLYGWENQLRWALFRNDTLTASTAFETGHYKSSTGSVMSFNDSAGQLVTLNVAGQHMDNIPAAIVSLGYEHEFRLPGGASLRFHGITRWSSAYRMSDFSQQMYFHQAAYHHSNADLQYTSADGQWATTMFVTNIENQVQVSSVQGLYIDGSGRIAPVATPVGAFNSFGSVGQPRLWGIRQWVNF